MNYKYQKYLNSNGCKKILATDYSQIIQNIIEDDELYITEEMKVEFFEYINKHDVLIDILDHCYNFFDQPINSTIDKKRYLFKGYEVQGRIYDTELGRVPSCFGFSMSLKKSIQFEYLKDTSNMAPLDDPSIDELIENLIIDFDDKNKTTLFSDFIKDTRIQKYKIQETFMWSFEGYYDNAVFRSYDVFDLPCILGLPNRKGTSENYNLSQRVAFSFYLPKDMAVRKPTCFDAGLMAVWRCGGKTKTHKECEKKYGEFGFSEYIHESILFEHINSPIYRLWK